MKNKTKWFDPICYQFSFYLLGKKDEAWNPVEATKPFFEELIPYYNLWIALQGTVMVSGTTSTGEWIRIAKNSEMLHDFHNKLEQQSHALHSFEITLVPDKTQLKFAVSVKALSKEWRQEVLQYTDLDDSITLGTPQKTTWLCQMLNCGSSHLT